jgi:uncharacterized protein (TIRG00374 family)
MTGDEGSAAGGNDRGRPSFRRWLMISVGSVVVIYTVGVIVVGGEDALAAFREARPLSLLGAVVLQAGVVLAWPLMHRSSLRAVGEDLAYPKVLQVSMSAFTVSRTAPAGGPVGGALAVERMTQFGVSGPAATASVALTGPITMTTVAVLLAVGAGTAAFTGDLPDGFFGVALLAVLALVAVVGGILAVLRTPSLGERLIDRLARIRRLRRAAERWRVSWTAVTEHAPSVRDIAPIFLWSTVKWAADIGSLALILVAVGQTPRPTVVLVGFGTTQLLAAIPTTPGSVGVVEGGLVGAFTAMGMASGVALTTAILYRTVESWIPATAGIPALFKKAQA